ncbi:MAG: ubiquinol-cytochrome c reductase iron-sulfur subunit [Burkholderiales bacterium]
MSEKDTDQGKRQFLVAASTVAGGVAAGAGAVPFVASMFPSERAKAAGAPVEVDLSTIAPGERKTIEWQGKPVWIVRRTKEMLETIRANDGNVADPESKKKMQPDYAANEMRAIKDEYLVVVGICTHLGCSPVEKFAKQAEAFDPNWQGGFYCPCHGSLFDLAGRVYKNKPAPDNLVVPPYKYLSDTRILVGDDSKGA